MAKAIICDRCKKAVPEDEVIKEGKELHLLVGDESFYIKASFISHNIPREICRECATELLLKAGIELLERAETVRKAGNKFLI